MTYHYIVAFENTILGVYGKELRELAFERAAEHRKKVPCEVFTCDGERQHAGAKFKNERKTK